MNENKLEMIKSFAAGMDIEDIANFADISIEEANEFAKINDNEIQERRKIMEEKGEV